MPKCPNTLGLYVRVHPMLVLHANEIRVQMPCDTEIDLVLADCFTPPIDQWSDAQQRRVELPAGRAAYRASVTTLDAAPRWLRAWFPVPDYDREWFRSFTPNSKQVGHLWISATKTLSDVLIEAGHASRVQAMPHSPLYDGRSLEALE